MERFRTDRESEGSCEDKDNGRRELNRRHGLVEKGALTVYLLLKGKIRSATVKIKNLFGKGLLINRTICSETTSLSCIKS